MLKVIQILTFFYANVLRLNALCMASFIDSKVVILGGGIHGASIAYYLVKKGIKPVIIERTGIAAAASGKSGGFLAREWGSGPTVALHRISFDMHATLAGELNVKSYRKIETISVDGGRKGPVAASWLDGKASTVAMRGATAQVTPKELTEKLFEAAKASGAEVIIGDAAGIIIADGKVTGVSVRNHGVIPADKVVLAMGPWTGPLAEDWFGMTLPMDGIKSTSVVIDGGDIVKAEPFACFCEEDNNGCHLEIYPRPNGDVYICGIGGSDIVNGDRLRAGGDCESAEQVEADPSRVSAALASLRGLSRSLGHLAPVTVQACMRPCPPDGLPVMGAVPNLEGAYISAGHNCWGILWAPVSGLCMAELIVDGVASTVDLKPFRADRFMSRGNSRGRRAGDTVVGEQW